MMSVLILPFFCYFAVSEAIFCRSCISSTDVWDSLPNRRNNTQPEVHKKCQEPSDDVVNLKSESCDGSCFVIANYEKGTAVRDCWESVFTSKAPSKGCKMENGTMTCICSDNYCNGQMCFDCATKNAPKSYFPQQEPKSYNDDCAHEHIALSLATSWTGCSSYCTFVNVTYDDSSKEPVIYRGCYDLMYGKVPDQSKVDKTTSENTYFPNGTSSEYICSKYLCNWSFGGASKLGFYPLSMLLSFITLLFSRII